MAQERLFTLKQVGVLITLASSVSGIGGAVTAKAIDAVQDARIAANEKAVQELRSQLSQMSTTTTQTQTQVGILAIDMKDVKQDLKDIQEMLFRLVGREDGRRRQ